MIAVPVTTVDTVKDAVTGVTGDSDEPEAATETEDK